jgi:hypothetical protein
MITSSATARPRDRLTASRLPRRYVPDEPATSRCLPHPAEQMIRRSPGSGGTTSPSGTPTWTERESATRCAARMDQQAHAAAALACNPASRPVNVVRTRSTRSATGEDAAPLAAEKDRQRDALRRCGSRRGSNPGSQDAGSAARRRCRPCQPVVSSQPPSEPVMLNST